MLLLSKILLVISGLIFIVDGVFIIQGKPNIINKEWPLPCPLLYILFGLGLVLYIISGG